MEKTVALLPWEKMDNRKFNSVGSSRIRMRWLLPYWKEAEEYIIGKKYEVMIFQKVYWKEMMTSFEGIKILDLCDPDWLEGKPVFEFVDLADAVTTSTPALAAYIKKLRPDKKHVLCIPDRVYMPEAVPVKSNYGDKLQKVVWFGYAHNARYLQSTFNELITRGLELICVSEAEIDIPYMYRSHLKVQNIPFNYASLNRELIKADAVLLPDPAEMDERGKYKSNNKVLQAWSLGLPVIRLPEDLDAFSSAAAREEEGKKRRKEVEELWDCKISVTEYQNLIEEIRKEKYA